MLKSLIIGFIPWILYFVFAGAGRKDQLDAAIIVALIAFLISGISSLMKGFILSLTTFIFFTFMLITVIWFDNDWMAEHALIASNVILAVIAWGSLLAKKPFTIQYAKQQIPSFKWNNALFIQINQILTAIWGTVFTLAIISYWLLIRYPELPNTVYPLLTNGFFIIGILFTIYFPSNYRFKKMREMTALSPFLHNNFAPVQDELDVDNLMIKGKIPSDLSGVYMRNGPNPAFPPLSYTYPFDGDGMIHAMYINHGQAHYRNRFIRTKGLETECRAGKAIYGGIMNPITPDAAFIGQDSDPGPFKNGAFIHIIHHAQKFLALWEGGPAYEMDETLRTLDEWRPGTEKPINVGPHTRLDPATGELWLINYDVKPPFLTAYCINAKGQLKKQIPIEKPYSTMMHDFVLTPHYLVFFDCPILLDINAIASGGNIIEWKPTLGTHIGLMSRRTGKTFWLNTETFFVFHFANAYETEDEIIVDYVRYPEFHWMNDKNQKNNKKPYLARTKIHLKTHQIIHEILDTHKIEFPRIRENKNTLPHRFIYAPAQISQTKYHALIKYDTQLKTSEIHDFGRHGEIGEAIFAPKKNGLDEDDGYLMLFVYHDNTKSSEFLILDAKNITSDPLASVALPRRVPNGLHGSWIDTKNH